MSSISTQTRPSTSPMTSRASTEFFVPLTPALVHDGQVGVQRVGVALGHLHPTGVGRHDDEVVAQARADVVDQHGHGGEVVDRPVEEALDLARVQVDAAPGGWRPAAWNMSATSLARDRLAALGLAVLAGVAVVGAHHGDALGRGPLGGVDHDQLLHDRVVHRHRLGAAVALDDEDVGAADRLAEAAVQLAVGELGQVRRRPADTPRCSAISSARAGGPAATSRCSRFFGDDFHPDP